MDILSMVYERPGAETRRIVRAQLACDATDVIGQEGFALRFQFSTSFKNIIPIRLRYEEYFRAYFFNE